MERDESGWVEGWRGMRVDGWKDGEGWEWTGGRMERDESGWVEGWRGMRVDGWKDGEG